MGMRTEATMDSQIATTPEKSMAWRCTHAFNASSCLA